MFVDFCEQMVKETNPSLLEKAEQTPRRRTPSIHGYRTIADIMRAFNPFTGEMYREALVMSRLTREMFCLMEGRHVHPSTLYPGGVGHGGRRRSCSPTTWSRLMQLHGLRQEARVR